ncbi:hypothetical protein BDP27DRAFT_607647 [Rhodocollybia butyracea]|uniref:Uncharacterized protein n=1 Tax=Rhodocollybia butyracea TaxID=206335 RepID=A0A9P5Q2V2_9AGAR|nr:hypothetical protein BDP27DRAFT_607647 [Rhodocollybia butyracea]
MAYSMQTSLSRRLHRMHNMHSLYARTYKRQDHFPSSRTPSPSMSVFSKLCQEVHDAPCSTAPAARVGFPFLCELALVVQVEVPDFKSNAFCCQYCVIHSYPSSWKMLVEDILCDWPMSGSGFVRELLRGCYPTDHRFFRATGWKERKTERSRLGTVGPRANNGQHERDIIGVVSGLATSLNDGTHSLSVASWCLFTSEVYPETPIYIQYLIQSYNSFSASKFTDVL